MRQHEDQPGKAYPSRGTVQPTGTTSLRLEQTEFRHRVDFDADTMAADFEPRLGESFPLQGELDATLDQFAAIETDLARSKSATGGGESDEFPAA